MPVGFAPLPERGDGYSLLKAKEVLATDGRFRYLSPEEEAQRQREDSFDLMSEDAKQRPKLVESIVFGSPYSPVRNAFECNAPNGNVTRGVSWDCGYWGVLLTSEKGPTKKYDWQCNVHLGDWSTYSPEITRTKLCKDLGEEAFYRWRQRQLDDLDSLRWCLNEACKELGKRKAVALSFVDSKSSARLLERLEVRVEQGWAFLFPHYKF